MSASVNVDPPVSPSPPTQKMNGGINTRPNFNFSFLNTSKHSLATGSPTGGAGLTNLTMTSTPGKPLLDLSRATTGHPSMNLSRHTLTPAKTDLHTKDPGDHGIYHTLASLALLCLLALMMAFLALFFLQKIGPLTLNMGNGKSFSTESPKKIVVGSEEFITVYQVSVALSTLTVSLNLCCLFVCSIQFLFAIKLMKAPQGEERTNKFLKRSSCTRVIAIGGFFLSIPIFFTGVILFTFIHFHEVPAIVTSIVIGLGIVFCGAVSVQNVYLWQWEKTQESRERVESRLSQLRESGLIGPDVTAHSMELSTLV
ncbi:uncharacterized protein LOC111085209 [Limulus polyphemus]|uniref:Uncharacterized protein LOC111085209 n=1 Tax=Limulus polyphemus TaxID=6850 RepID=A0ABM1S4C4_LIMPO|nr:uncharacterized protein LOC111085209 [Limulus polyphemus]